MPLDTRFALYDLTDDETRTAMHIVHRAAAPATMTLMPTHHIDASGQLLGFRLTMPPQTPVGAAPFTPHMFVGLGMCECVVDPVDVARLIGDAAACKARLLELIEAIDTRSTHAAVAGQDCMPIDVDGKCKDMSGVSMVRSNARRAVDIKVWEVERPAMLGVFHAFVRNALGERRHAVFVACEGGCYKASNEYYNMMVDLGDRATMDEAVQCEETWWLQKAASRARNRIMYMALEALGLKPRAAVTDVHSLDNRRVVTPVCETLRHDIARLPDGNIEMLNHAVDTTRAQNGILCKMHPVEGLWVFRGAARANSRCGAFGSIFGDHSVCGAFPTHTFATDDKRHAGITVGSGGDRRRYLHFNNRFMQNLQEMGWDRDYGIVECVPIAVVYADEGGPACIKARARQVGRDAAGQPEPGVCDELAG